MLEDNDTLLKKETEKTICVGSRLYPALSYIVRPFEFFEVGRGDRLQFLYQLEDPDNLLSGLGRQGIEEVLGRTSAVLSSVEIDPSHVHQNRLTRMLTYFKGEVSLRGFLVRRRTTWFGYS